MATDEAEPRSGSRDHPDSIRRRIRGVGLATAGSLLGVWWVVKQAGSYKGIDAVCSWFEAGATAEASRSDQPSDS